MLKVTTCIKFTQRCYKFGNFGFELLRVSWEVPVLKLFVSVILLIVFFQ